MRAMLYYPFPQPPREILAQAVLYWDRMGSIVPDHRRIPDYLRELEERGLYEPLRADTHLDERSVNWLVAQVEGLVGGHSLNDLYKVYPLTVNETRLNYGTLPVEVADRLMSAGLLREVRSSSMGGDVLLGVVLSLLARAIAEIEPDPTVGWVCHTDVQRAAGMTFGSDAAHGVPAWRLNMGAIFKVPVAGTSLDELLDFRDRYEDERVELLRAVDRFVAECGGASASDLIPQISEEVEHAVAQIQRASRARGIKLRKAAAFGTLAAGSGAAVSAAPVLGSAAEAAVAAGGFGLLGSLLADATRTFLKPEAVSPYNYMHRVRSQFA